MKAIAWPAADSTQPVLSAVDDDRGAGRQRRARRRLAGEAHAGARAVGGALEHPDRAGAGASTATTVSAAPADRIITGAATETATGSSDSALASDSVDCAPAWPTVQVRRRRPRRAQDMRIGEHREFM